MTSIRPWREVAIPTPTCSKARFNSPSLPPTSQPSAPTRRPDVYKPGVSEMANPRTAPGRKAAPKVVAPQQKLWVKMPARMGLCPSSFCGCKFSSRGCKFSSRGCEFSTCTFLRHDGNLVATRHAGICSSTGSKPVFLNCGCKFSHVGASFQLALPRQDGNLVATRDTGI